MRKRQYYKVRLHYSRKMRGITNSSVFLYGIKGGGWVHLLKCGRCCLLSGHQELIFISSMHCSGELSNLVFLFSMLSPLPVRCCISYSMPIICIKKSELLSQTYHTRWSRNSGNTISTTDIIHSSVCVQGLVDQYKKSFDTNHNHSSSIVQ